MPIDSSYKLKQNEGNQFGVNDRWGTIKIQETPKMYIFIMQMRLAAAACEWNQRSLAYQTR